MILPAIAALFAAAPALGQETIYIGGSGAAGVEIDLGALDQLGQRVAPRRVIVFDLRHPGVETSNLPPVKLRPPSEAAPAETMTSKAPAPVEAAAVEVVTKLDPPPQLKLEPIEEQAPKKEPETDPNKMTKEERAAAAVTEKPAEKLAAKPAKKTQMAALDPADVPTLPGQSMQITFAAGDAALPEAARAPLAAIAAMLEQDDTLRLQLKAFAGGGADSASHARRLSLSRALAVRSQLIEEGVRSTRIDVRALGNKSENGTSDRVDVILVKR